MIRDVPTQDPEYLRSMYYEQRQAFCDVVKDIADAVTSGLIADVTMEIRTNDCESWTLEITTPHNPPLFPNADNTNYKPVDQIIDNV